MNNNLQNIRKALEVMGACPYCNQTSLVMATGFKGHGTGQHGAAHYGATGFQQVKPDTHCICMGGPVWQQIAIKNFGVETKMHAGFEIWRRLPEDQRNVCVVIWSPNGSWVTFTLELWRKLLVENWDEINK